MKEHPTLLEVNALPAFANSLLNGSRGLLLYEWDQGVTLLLLTGPDAGREWQFCKDHVRVPYA